MLKDELREKARKVCAIPETYKLEIEDYAEDGTRAVFIWNHPEEMDMGIWIELDENGKLVDFTKDEINPPLNAALLHVEELKQTALQFAESHYPGAVQEFEEEFVKKSDNQLRVSYIQKELNLPLPFTGFYITITEYGEIVRFHYDGSAENVIIPQHIEAEKKVRSEFLKEVKMNLKIANLEESIYENADNRPHLVYEPELPFYRRRVDGLLNELSEEEEETKVPVYVKIPKMEAGSIPESLTELDGSMIKIREQDLDDAIGEVYRKQEAEPVISESDPSIIGFFNKRNENTVKLKRNKETGQLLGLYSFIERRGPLMMSEEECKEIAFQFLSGIFPDAHLYFQLDQSQMESDEDRVLFCFDLIHHDIPILFGTARINIDRTTGKVTHYLGADVDPDLIISINPDPAISEETAQKFFEQVFQIEKQWSKEYKDNEESYYQLVYSPVYPNLSGELRFIKAENGEMVVGKQF